MTTAAAKPTATSDGDYTHSQILRILTGLLIARPDHRLHRHPHHR